MRAVRRRLAVSFATFADFDRGTIPGRGDFSGYETAPNGLGNGVSAIVNAELGLCFFEVCTDRLFSELEQIRHIPDLVPDRHQPQYRQLTRRQRCMITMPPGLDRKSVV